MSHEDTSRSTTPNSDASTANGPGQRLKSIREQQKLSIDYVAEKIRLRPNQVKALEIDDYSYAPPTFARGHLCLYARLMGVPINEILKAFDALGYGEKEPAPLELPAVLDNPQELRNSSSDRYPSITRLFTYGILFLLLVAIAVWWFHHRDKEYKSKMIGKEMTANERVKAGQIPLVIPPMKNPPVVNGPVRPRKKEPIPRDNDSQE